MTGKNTLVLTGNDLTIQEIGEIVNNTGIFVRVADTALARAKKAKAFLDQESSNRIIYGVNTGFGPMASYAIGKEQLAELQTNLIRSHAVGMGKPISADYVLAAMVIRLNTLAKGYSGVSPQLLKRLETFINQRIIPCVPEHGSVGTSGDLVQLAHIALALIGEGEVFYGGEVRSTAQVVKKLGLGEYQLQPKEGLALINGTSMMSGIAALVCLDAKRLLDLSIREGAFALELVRGFNDSTSERLHGLRPHRGQTAVARTLRNILRTSRMRRSRKSLRTSEAHLSEEVSELPEVIQEIYSFRCIAQILGPVFDTLDHTWKTVEIEINSVTDNPIVDWEHHSFIHGGNFHGDYIAAAVDQLKMTLVKMTMLSERRTNFFLSEHVNKQHFPPFLNLNEPGLTLALQGLQFVATSTTSQSQTLAFPQYVHSIPTNADNQDIVSMGTDAALLAAKVVENAFVVLSIEAITLAQAVDVLRAEEDISESSRNLFQGVRREFSKITHDRNMTQELSRVVYCMRSSNPGNFA